MFIFQIYIKFDILMVNTIIFIIFVYVDYKINIFLINLYMIHENINIHIIYQICIFVMYHSIRITIYLFHFSLPPLIDFLIPIIILMFLFHIFRV